MYTKLILNLIPPKRDSIRKANIGRTCLQSFQDSYLMSCRFCQSLCDSWQPKDDIEQSIATEQLQRLALLVRCHSVIICVCFNQVHSLSEADLVFSRIV